MNNSNRILKLFKDKKRKDEKFFMPFLVAGDPNIDEFKILVEKIEPYSDIIEIGLPFSDPIADGPTIQEANVRAFNAGINTKVALSVIKDIRTRTEKPIVILTYYNILIQGADTIEDSLDKTFKNLKECGYKNVSVIVGDGTLGYKEKAPYDRILVTAGAPKIPGALTLQLSDNGKMVIPVGGRFQQELILIEKKKGKIIEKKSGDVFSSR